MAYAPPAMAGANPIQPFLFPGTGQQAQGQGTGGAGVPNLTGNGLPNLTGGANNLAGTIAQAAGVDPKVAQIVNQGLSIVQNPQSLQTVGQVASLLNNPSIGNLMQGLNAIQQGQAIDGLLKMAINPQNAGQLANAGAGLLANTIAQQAPQLAQALQGFAAGGVQGAVQQALAAVAGQQAANVLGGAAAAALGGALGGAGGGGGGQGAEGQNYSVQTQPANIGGCNTGCAACGHCRAWIPRHYSQVRAEITSEFQKHRSWIVNTFWLENILPALMLMAEQLSVAGIQQVNMFGAMLDAKHQLETQRLFQQMTAEAHKDYHPSEGMCTFGTTVRSLANSERKSDLAQITFAGRMNQRQLLSSDVLSAEGGVSDIRSRLDKYRKIYCERTDNSKGLEKFCPSVTGKPERRNIDVDYTRGIESKLTIETDFTKDGSTLSEDEEDVFALSANLFAHNIPPRIPPEKMGVPDGRVRETAAERYMDLRAIFAKRSVAQNSFAAIVAERAQGSPESAPYTKALMKELGIEDTAEIEKILGKNPSYFAQMEILTKKIYQNPTFYTELYDKPANIARKGAALQAIGLMQDRDLFDSLIRTEAVLSVLLETMLQKEQSKIMNQLPAQTPVGGAR